MTNLGFRLGDGRARGIHVVETAVGDRYVLEALDAGGYSLGGEQSGHVIFRDLATTGDGLLTGLWLLDLVRRSGRPLAELAAEAMTRLPQVLRQRGGRPIRTPTSRELIADGHRRRRGRARRPRPGAGASERHRAARPGDGRGADRRTRRGAVADRLVDGGRSGLLGLSARLPPGPVGSPAGARQE